MKKKKETKNEKTNLPTNTLYSKFWKNVLIVLHTKIPKLNDKKKIDIVVKMLQENDVTLKPISILLR